MSGTVTSLAPYLIIFGAGLGLFAALRLLWTAQPPWLEALSFLLCCLLAFWALQRPDLALVQDRLLSVIHAALAVLAGGAAAILAKDRKWVAVLWILGLTWAGTSLVLWMLTLQGAPLTWSKLAAACVLSGVLWFYIGRPQAERPINRFTMLLVGGLAMLCGFANLPALSASLWAVLSLLAAGGAVAFYRPALMPHGVTGIAGLSVAAGASALAFTNPAAIPSLLILALTLFSSKAVQFSTPAESGLEVLGRKLLIVSVNAVPLVLALMVGYVTLTNP